VWVDWWAVECPLAQLPSASGLVTPRRVLEEEAWEFEMWVDVLAERVWRLAAEA